MARVPKTNTDNVGDDFKQMSFGIDWSMPKIANYSQDSCVGHSVDVCYELWI